MDEHEIASLIERLDGRGSSAEFDAVRKLTSLGDEFPELLLSHYRSTKDWSARTACVYHAFRYAQDNDHALQLGIEALQDRSKKVRYRACQLLAYAQKQEALAPLKLLLSDEQSHADAAAAIDAIESSNHNYFVDREHSGKITMDVETLNS